MKAKRLPGFVRHPGLAACFQSRAGRIASNWVLQGMLYMNPIETGFKLALEAVLLLAWRALLSGVPGVEGWAWALVLAHTSNWVLNGQPVAMLRHLDWGRTDPRHFIAYIEALQRRVGRCGVLLGAAAFGSLSRGGFKATSDLDLRLVLRPDLPSRVALAGFCFLERIRAAVAGFPLDLYAFDLEELRRKMSPNEVPVIFADPQGVVGRAYETWVPFAEFVERFRRSHVAGGLDGR